MQAKRAWIPANKPPLPSAKPPSPPPAAQEAPKESPKAQVTASVAASPEAAAAKDLCSADKLCVVAFAHNIATFRATQLKLFKKAAKKFRNDVEVFVVDGSTAGYCQKALGLSMADNSVIAYSSDSGEYAQLHGLLSESSLAVFINRQLTSGISGIR